MYDPLGACGDYQFRILSKHHPQRYFGLQQHFDMLPGENQSSVPPDAMPALLPTGDEGIAAPASSSIWLEQGEYFFDDEFSIPMDAEDANISALDSVDTDCGGGRVSPCGMDAEPRVSLQLDQSCADSCICTPGDSAENALNKTPAQSNSINHLLSNGLPSTVRSDSKDAVVLSKTVGPDTVANDPSRTSLHKAAPQESIQGSRSGSLSWMQQMMERSCNPELKALLKRAAATADYKLAYTDPLPTDSCTTSCTKPSSTKYDNSIKLGPNGLVRSFSHNNIFTADDLVGLRNALNQAARILSKPDSGSPFPVAARSATLTASVGTQHDSALLPTNLESQQRVTTWAQKHGSRGSLKRRQEFRTETDSKTDKVPVDSVAAAAIATHIPSSTECISPWRAIKEASNTLVTWNQLKRTIKRDKASGHTMSLRSGRLQHDNDVGRVALVNVTSDTQLLDQFMSKPASRSRSQPPTANAYMYRFSGTLLEIFMRAKAMEASIRDSESTDAFGHRGCEAENHSLQDQVRHLDNTSTQNARRTALTNAEVEAAEDIKYMCHFGAQFPPVDSADALHDHLRMTYPTPLRSSSPVLANVPQLKRGGVTGRTSYPSEFRFSQPITRTTGSRPQSFGSGKHHAIPASDSKSSNVSPEVAACLTASAGPDSTYMDALREECMADGLSIGWIRNPRASIAYPGLGLLAVPRPSRLAGATFLSHTLPDLSFLGLAGAEEERKGTPTMPKRMISCACRCHPISERCCAKCGCRSSSVGRAAFMCGYHPTDLPFKSRRPGLKTYTFHPDALDNQGHSGQAGTAVPDLVAGHAGSPVQCPSTGSDSTFRQQSALRKAVAHPDKTDRFCSEPNLNSALTNLSDPMSGASVDATGDSYPRPSTLMTSSSQACYGWDSNKTSNVSDRPCGRPKKSVSFSGNIRHLRACTSAGGRQESTATSPEPKVIPRNWGLYGQEPPLAEFNPRISPGRDTAPAAQTSLQSDVDVRYHAMVSDVIKAVQETVAYYSSARAAAAATVTSRDPLPYTTIAALGSTGRQPLLAVVSPLTVLLCDGLLPQNRTIFTSKPRTRLWQMVEESCRPSAQLTGVAFRVLSDAVGQVKALTNVTLERAKFKAFLCACLNAKALPMWMNSVVANESLLGRFYYADAFLRQCRSSLRGLYADLMTHLEQLLAFPFNLDVAVEARKPLGDSGISSKHGATPLHHAASTPNSTPSKPPVRPTVPPAVVMPRKTQPSLEKRNHMSPARSTINANIHHYPPHHLPGQRPLNPRSRLNTARSPGDDSEVSSVSSTGDTPAKVIKKPVPTPTTSPVRGKLKTALSTFRRTTPTSPTQSSDTAGVTNRSTNIPTVPDHRPTPSRPRSTVMPMDPDRNKTRSKLRPPTSVTGATPR